MIVINLGFPKTSTTNLQINVYPNLQGISYLGKNYKKNSTELIYENSKLFNELNDFIENQRKFSKTDLNKLIKNFGNYCKNKKKVLVSNENWIVPYQKNFLTNKTEIVNQEVKLKNLLFILDKIKIPYKFFFIHRDLQISITSLFVTLKDHIYYLFGEKFLSFNYFLEYIYKKRDGYKDLLLFLDCYNLKKILKIIPKDKIQIFNYEDVIKNQKIFINNLSNYLGIEKNYDMIENLNIPTNITSKNEEKEYTFDTKNKMAEILKLLIPEFLINKFKFLLKIKFIRNFFFKKMKVKRTLILEKIINEYF